MCETAANGSLGLQDRLNSDGARHRASAVPAVMKSADLVWLMTIQLSLDPQQHRHKMVLHRVEQSVRSACKILFNLHNWL